jgi:hypothetical protein
MLVQCTQCGKEVNKKPAELKKYKPFCNQKCAKAYKRIGINTICYTCGKSCYKSPYQQKKSTSGNLFCSRACSTVHNNQQRLADRHWAFKGNDYRKLAIEHYGLKCQTGEDCPLSSIDNLPSFMYDVHHIDEDRSNNRIENLIVLCVWCHKAHHYV